MYIYIFKFIANNEVCNVHYFPIGLNGWFINHIHILFGASEMDPEY
jgi:hypothetical protein